MARRHYVGAAVTTTITAGINASDLAVSIADATGWPDGSVGKFAVVISEGTVREEKVLVTSRSGTALTITSGDRGHDDTTAKTHNSGDAIRMCITSDDVDEPNAHINATSAAHAGTAISFPASGTIAATNVTAAIQELDSETDARLDAIEAANWVTNARMATDSVNTDEIVASAVGTAELANGAVTHAKMAATPTTRLRRAATQTIPASSSASITWDAEDEDDLGLITVPTNTLTIPASQDGIYAITAVVDTAAGEGLGASGAFSILAGGFDFYLPLTGTSTVPDVPAANCIVVPLAAADTILVTVTNGATSDRAITARLYVVQLGPR